jgi:hypothetical protein
MDLNIKNNIRIDDKFIFEIFEILEKCLNYCIREYELKFLEEKIANLLELEIINF